MRFNPTLLGFIRKEFRQALRDPKMRFLLFGAPMIQLTLFGVALTSETKNVRLSVRGAPGDTVLHDIHRRALASGWFIPAGVAEKADPFEAIRSNDVDAVLVAPPGGLTASLGRGEGQAQLLVDATNVLRASAVEQYLLSISDRVAGEYLKGPPREAPVRFELRILFNPTMRSAVYMVPGVMGMLICLVTILLTSMAIAREKEIGTFETLIAAPISTREIIFGKTLPYIVLGMSNLPLILGVAILVFEVPLRGSLLALAVATFVYVCATVSLGTLISTLARTQQQAMMGSFLFLFPAIQLSGLMFPISNMPVYMQALAYMNPLTYFLELVRNIMLKGGDVQFLLLRLGALSAITAVLVALSFRRFRMTLS